MTRARRIVFLALGAALLGPRPASADGEVSGVVGALVGGNLDALRQGNVSIERSFQNSPLYGARAAFVGFPLGVEASIVGSPSGLNLTAADGLVALDARVLYLEANLLLIPVPGPVSPFVSAGAGLHSFDFNLSVAGVGVVATNVRKLGYAFGGGLRVKISRIVLRAEARDHVTDFNLDDFGLGPIGALVGSDQSQRLHNVEISLALGVRF